MYLYLASQISCISTHRDASGIQWGARQIAHDDPCDDAVRHEACLGGSMQGLQKLWNPPLHTCRAFCHARRGSEAMEQAGLPRRVQQAAY